jgi:hypothetical protein
VLIDSGRSASLSATEDITVGCLQAALPFSVHLSPGLEFGRFCVQRCLFDIEPDITLALKGGNEGLGLLNGGSEDGSIYGSGRPQATLDATDVVDGVT